MTFGRAIAGEAGRQCAKYALYVVIGALTIGTALGLMLTL